MSIDSKLALMALISGWADVQAFANDDQPREESSELFSHSSVYPVMSEVPSFFINPLDSCRNTDCLGSRGSML